jgi:hypothetical protein
MGTTPRETIIFRDHDGNCYELSREVLVRARVSEERMGEIERSLGDDTAGFLNFTRSEVVLLPAILNLSSPPLTKPYQTGG